jgi:uroporphyrinogen III methyltransferase/synthase
MAEKGIVFIVGAGPDVPGLLTVRGTELLGSADAVVYERRAQRKLIPGGAAGGPRRFYVGRRAGSPRAPVADVALLLVQLARGDRRVVYLAHGDPLAAGRGSELVTALHDADVLFEIVPGVPVAQSAAAYAGIPLLSPTLASSAIFVNGGASASGAREPDWSAIAKVGATVVVRNAGAALTALVAGFAVAGVPGEIPAAAIVNAGRASQRTIVTTLGMIQDEILRAGMTRSVTVIVGWSVLLRDELEWFQTRPLFGTRIIFAKPRYGPTTVADRLRELGALVIDVPQPGIARLDLDGLRDEIERIAGYEWIVFSTPDAVAIFWEQLILSGRDTRSLSNAKIACVGSATAAALLDRGITTDATQDRFEPTALLDTLAELPDVPGASLLYVAEDSTAESYGRDLEQAGAAVTSLALYREVLAESVAERWRHVLQQRHADLIVAMSPGAAEDYVRAASEHSIMAVPAAAADAATAEVLREAGIEVIIEPATPGADSLAAAIQARFARRAGP